MPAKCAIWVLSCMHSSVLVVGGILPMGTLLYAQQCIVCVCVCVGGGGGGGGSHGFPPVCTEVYVCVCVCVCVGGGGGGGGGGGFPWVPSCMHSSVLDCYGKGNGLRRSYAK